MPETIIFLLTITLVILVLLSQNQNKKIMATFEEIQAQIESIKSSTANIAADLERIAGEIAGGLKKSEADKVAADLTAAATALKAVADINPEPAEPPAPEQPGEGDEN